MKENLITMRDIDPGRQEVTLNVAALFPNQRLKKQFEEKFAEFKNCDPIHSRLFEKKDDLVIYRTECIIPKNSDQRPPLLLVFGNPASHSVDAGMFFAYEGKKKEHRFWKAMREADILSFSDGVENNPLEQLNSLKKKELYELGYRSPFRIGLAVYYSMPSLASKRPWAQVAGLLRLFGEEALSRIGECEKNRINGLIKEFVSPNGAVFAFQKDAYSAIMSSTSPMYMEERAKGGDLIGNCQCDSAIKLFGLPKTYLLPGYLNILRDFRNRILNAS